MEALVPQDQWSELSAQLSQDAAVRAAEKTPGRFVKRREGRGGKLFDYVQKNWCKEWLNDHFPGWSRTIDGPAQVFEGAGYGSVAVRGHLNIIERGIPRTCGDFGSAEIKYYATGLRKGQPINIAEDTKVAVTDNLKRCAANFGFASDIYDPEGDPEPTKEQLDRLTMLANHSSVIERERVRLLQLISERALTDDSADVWIKKVEAYIDKHNAEARDAEARAKIYTDTHKEGIPE